MKLSIAMATYNGECFLAKQLESFASQKYQPDEILVSDDNSSDATVSILEDFCDRMSSNMFIIRNNINLGYSGNFNRALTECTGDLVFLADQDDWWFPEKLALMTRWATEQPDIAIFACDAELTDVKLVPSGRSKLGQIEALGMPKAAFVMGCCLAIRREFLDLVLPIPAKALAHDTWLVEIADRFGLVERRGEILQYYRQHGRNTSDFSANTIEAIGPARRTMLWAKGVKRRLSSSGGLEKELANLRMQLAHLEGVRHEVFAYVGQDKALAGFSSLEAKIAQLEARATVRSTSLPKRPLAVILNWTKAGYDNHAGLGGAIRDLTVRSGTT